MDFFVKLIKHNANTGVFFLKKEYASRLHVYALPEKIGKFNNFLRFRALFGKVLRLNYGF